MGLYVFSLGIVMWNPCWTCVTSALDINFPGLRTTPYCSKAMVSVFRSGSFVNTPPHHAAVRMRNIWNEPILILFIISLIPYRADTIRSSGAIALLFPHSYCLVIAGRTPFSSFPRLLVVIPYCFILEIWRHPTQTWRW